MEFNCAVHAPFSQQPITQAAALQGKFAGKPQGLSIVQKLARHVPQYEMWAFGSRATGAAKEYSDLDLAIITDQPLDLSLSAAISDDFAESDLPIKVNVVDWATTNEAFRRIIQKDKIVIQSRGQRK